MNATGFRTTRTAAIGAMFFVILMLGVPSFFTPGQQIGVVSEAAAVDVDRDFIVGVSELSVATLNPNTYTMVGEGMLIFPCYSTLLQFDKAAQNNIGDLAYDWSCSPDGLTWNFKIVDNAYFCDPADPYSTAHKVTAYDVEYSFMTLQEEDGSRLHTYFPDIIQEFNIINDYEFDIALNGPYATIMESWRGALVLPKYIWETEDFINFDNEPPIGSGAFYYATDGLPEAGQAELARNPIWYGTENHGWQMHCDRFVMVEELSDDTAWIDVVAGEIDVMLGVNPSVYVTNLLVPGTTPNVVGYSQCNGFVYEFNLNQMSDELRDELGGQYLSGSSNQLLLDEDVKLAMSYCIDKYGFVEENLYGLGSYADSLVPPQNPGHYSYPTPDPYDPELARQTLWDAGWKYKLNGDAITYGSTDYYEYYPLCKAGGADPLQFDFVTLDNDVLWTVCAKYMVNTTRMGGFDLQLRVESTNDMNSAWYQADYDIWLWDWVMGVTSEPVSIMEVFASEAIGTDQDVYWVNETFDEIYHRALTTMDPVARLELTDQLQALAYEMRACQCVAYREELYAVNVEYWAEESLGDWENDYFMLPDVWPWWLSMSIYPNENNAPDLYSLPSDVEAEVGVAETFSANANDDDLTTPLEYRWFWGDGTKSAWSSSNAATHTYSTDGIYFADVAVREAGSSNGFEDYFMVSKQFQVTVRDLSNAPPVIGVMGFSTTSPDTGDVIDMTVTATDPESDDLFYTWSFGDGYSAYGDSVSHQYTVDGSYTVTVSVDDGRIGEADTRPATQSQLLAVAMNHAPTISVGDVANIQAKQTETYTVTASDIDPDDDLIYTWDWDDGTIDVTTVPTADHLYNSRGTYTLTVYVDDQTNLAGHNVSDIGLISVVSMAKNKVPVITSFTVDDSTPFTEQTVTFTGVASDGDGDALTFTMELESEVFVVEEFDVSADNTLRTMTATYTYAAGGTYSAYLSVYDGVDNTTITTPLSITVTANDPPTVVLTPEWGDTGAEISFSASVLDPDDATLSYYWTWGDGTATVTTVSDATHTYAESGAYQYRLYVNDGHFHNVSDLAVCTVNAVPSFNSLLSDFSVDAGVEKTFTADVSDPDLTDVMNYTWDFGDGSDLAYGETVTHTYATMGPYTYTLTVWDSFEDDVGPVATHMLEDEGTATVTDPLVNDPPEITPLSDIELTVDEVYTFTVVATDPEDDPLVITWDFDDGSDLAVGNGIDHSYSSEGTYTVSVWVDDGATNVTDSFDVVVGADQVPVADAGNDRTVNEDTPILFDGSDSSDDVDVVAWDWTIYEDAVAIETMTGEFPSYEFAEPGVYTVELIVTDTIDQTSAPDTITVTVLDITDPTAVAAADPMTVDMGGSVDFDASASTDNVAGTLTYEWSFFDGSVAVTETTATFSHTFDVAGSFPVTLTVTDAAGNEGTDEVTITVVDIEAPIANAGADDAVNIGELYTLDGSLSTDNDEIVSWTWTFTDVTAQTLDGEMADYTFGNAGVFVITLTVEDAAGNSDTDTVTITVSDEEAPVAVAVDVEITEGETATLDASGSTDNVDVTAWEWVFTYDGAEVTLTEEVSTYQFDIPDIYDVVLTVWDDAGHSDSITITVTVLDDADPVANAGADIADAVVGTAVEFDGSASTDDVSIENWTWSIDSVEVAWGETASYTFDAAGTYTVTLTVTDSFGQTATDTLTVTVTEEPGLSEAPVADAGPDATIDLDDDYEFDGSDSTDDVGIVNWTWEFEYDDEMVTLYGETVEFTFEIAGDYLVELTVTDADGQTDSDTVTITVEEPEEEEPEEKSFIEQYGLAIGAIAAIAAVLVVAMLLMKKRKGGQSASGLEGVSSESEPPSQ